MKELENQEIASLEENEIKIQLTDVEVSSALDRLQLMPADRRKLQQKDTYFDTLNLYLTNLNRGLRSRFEDGECKELEFKSLFYVPEVTENPWFIEEVKMAVPLSPASQQKLNLIFRRLSLPTLVISNDSIDFDMLEEFLLSSGLAPLIVVNKHRQSFDTEEATYTLDEISGLGTFLEIEAKNDNNAISLLKSRFGKTEASVIREGYNDMIGKSLEGFIPNDVRQRRFITKPSWNVLPSERNYLDQITQTRRING